MSYMALYRKFRPTTFDEVKGQDHIVTTLKNQIRTGRIGHAYLFCGTRGTGKTTVAKILAKAVNCENPQDGEPCNECETCREIIEGSSMNVMEIDAASNNGVDNIRDIKEQVQYSPASGKYKVYIIDEVHMMSTGAFNALLKTIEEPPAHVIFIFATTEPHKVLPTIISRCQRFDFHKVSVSDIVERLQYVLDQEHIQMDEEAVRMIALLADGGMRDALSILDQCIAYAQDAITIEDINSIYGITTPAEKGLLLHNVIQNNYLEMVNQIEELNEKGIDIRRLTSDLIDLLKESLIYSLTEDEHLISSAYQDVIREQLIQIPKSRRFQMLDVLMDTFEKYRNASDVLSYFEVAMLKLLNIGEEKTTAEISSTDSSADNKPKVQPVIQNRMNDLSKADRPIEKPAADPQIPLADLPKKENDVSRETSKQPAMPLEPRETAEKKQECLFDMEEEAQKEQSATKEEPSLMIDDTYVLRLLVGANKQERQMDDEKFRDLPDYLNELDWAKYANAIKNTEIVASGKNYIVLSAASTIEAKEINQIEQKEGFLSFTNQLLGISKKVFAIDHEQRKRVIGRFKEQMIQGKLPEPVHIEVKKEKKQKETVKTTEEKLTDLFGDEIVFMEE